MKPKDHISPSERAKDPEVSKRIDKKLQKMLQEDEVKKLKKGDGWIGGVCAGLGEYFGIDPNILRIVWALALCAGFGFFLYILFWIFMPE